MKKIYLVRHAQSEENLQQRCLSGVNESVLSTVGKNQAKKLGECFGNFRIDEIYSSPLPRAIQTCEIAFPNMISEIKVTDSLIEFDFGVYDGVIPNKSKCEDQIIRRWNEAPGNLSFPGGDSVAFHAETKFAALKQLIASSTGNNIVCMSHRVTIRLVVAKLLGLDLDRFRKIPCGNCSVTELSLKHAEGIEIISISAWGPLQED